MPPPIHGKSKSGKLACLPAFFSISFGVFEARVFTLPMHFVWGCGAARVCFPSYKIRSSVGESQTRKFACLGLAMGLP